MESTQLLEEAVNIAWVYLQRTGQLGDGHSAAVFLSNAVEAMIRKGQRHRMFLANMAILKYRSIEESRNVVTIAENA